MTTGTLRPCRPRWARLGRHLDLHQSSASGYGLSSIGVSGTFTIKSQVYNDSDTQGEPVSISCDPFSSPPCADRSVRLASAGCKSALCVRGAFAAAFGDGWRCPGRSGMITQLSHKPWMRLLAALMAAACAAIPTPLTLPVGTAAFLMTSDEFEKHSFPAGFYMMIVRTVGQNVF